MADPAERMTLYQQILDHIPDAVICLDQDCRIIYANEVVARNLACSSADLIGHMPLELPIPPDVSDIWMQAVQRVIQTGKLETITFRLIIAGQEEIHQADLTPEYASDGTVRTVVTITRTITEQLRTEAELRTNEAQFRLIFDQSPIGAAITGGERTRYLLGLIEDITEQKRLADERHRMEQQLQEAQRLESLGVLAGGIAHDFNNILVGILGYAELAISDLPENHTAHDHIRHVIGGAQRAADLVSQILAYAGKRTVAPQPLQLNTLVLEMRNLLHTSFASSASLTYDLAPDLPLIYAGATQIRQMMLNLVTNAAEALQPGGGHITISTALDTLKQSALEHLKLGAERQPGQYVRLSVSDTGCGMDEATRARMFEPFFTTKFIGRGLGLAAVHGIVRTHHGMLHVESTPGMGTSVTVWLPVAPAQVARPPSDHEPPPAVMLVISSDDATREILRRLLPHLGVQAITAADEQAGIRLLNEQPHRFSSALIDLATPTLPGAPLATTLQTRHPNTPVILLTSSHPDSAAQPFRALRLAGTLQKPFTLDEIRSLVRKI